VVHKQVSLRALWSEVNILEGAEKEEKRREERKMQSVRKEAKYDLYVTPSWARRNVQKAIKVIGLCLMLVCVQCIAPTWQQQQQQQLQLQQQQLQLQLVLTSGPHLGGIRGTTSASHAQSGGSRLSQLSFPLARAGGGAKPPTN